MDEPTTQPTIPLESPAEGRFRAFAGEARVLLPFGIVLRAPDHVGESLPRPKDPLAPPTGRHWKAFAACGPLLIGLGLLLHVLGHAGTGNFSAVVGACVLGTHLYMRFRALDVVDVFHTDILP